jgi:hypothetical protein
MGELMTKVTIAFGFVVFTKLGYWSPGVATVLAVVFLGLSFHRDARLKQPDRQRYFPTTAAFGWQQWLCRSRSSGGWNGFCPRM